MKYFKATRPDGTDFRTGRIDYGAALASGEPVAHPSPVRGSDHPRDYLSVSTEPGDCTAFQWPARLFEVTPVGRTWKPDESNLPNKRAAAAVKVLREVPGSEVFGPQGVQIVVLLNRFASMTPTGRDGLYRARPSDWWDAYAVAYHGGLASRAGLEAARGALYYRLRVWRDGGYAAYGAALALLLRHTIGKKDGLPQATYDVLATPWVKTTGAPLHPEDAD